MAADHPDPWNPDRRWADPLIALLALAIVCLLTWRAQLERRFPGRAPDQASVQARLLELRQAAQDLARSRLGNLLPNESPEAMAAMVSSPWDRALVAILAAESGAPKLGRTMAMEGAFPGGEPFRRCYSAAYLAQGGTPTETERAAVRAALRNGYAARLLEARLQADAGSAEQLRDEARSWALPRLASLAVAGLAVLILVPSGIAMAILLVASSRKPRPFPVPEIRLSGRALALLFLGWFLVFLSSGLVVGSFLAGISFLRPYALPLTYGFHAGVGIAFLCSAEGLTPWALLRRLMPGAHLKSLAWGVGFLALAAVMVLGVSLAMSPFLRSQESPQQELMDLVAGTQGLLPVLTLFLTISIAAPIFEEGLFRGTLLPWLGLRLEKRMGAPSAWLTALLVSSVGFGLIHLQPAALPVLSTLGMALGMAFLRTRNLVTAMLVHGLWNGGVFLFYRTVLG